MEAEPVAVAPCALVVAVSMLDEANICGPSMDGMHLAAHATTHNARQDMRPTRCVK